MLAANEAVARVMKRHASRIYRVHDEPDEEKLQELRETMSTYGVKCGKLTNPQGMSALLRQLGPAQGYTLKTHVLRSLKQAQYRAAPMAATDSPNRTTPTSPRRSATRLDRAPRVRRLPAPAQHDSAPAQPDAKYALSKLESIATTSRVPSATVSTPSASR